MSVTAGQQRSTISYGTIATSVALFMFLAMLALLADRWAGRFPPLPDFSSYGQTGEMKAAFIEYLTPVVEYHNEQILSKRKRLEWIQKSMALGKSPSYSEAKWIRLLADRYDVEWNENQLPAVMQALLEKVDIVPVQLAVVQAAKESSWGRSRYAVEVNNIFGEWCYRKGCGIVPKERSEGAESEKAERSRVRNGETPVPT